MTEIRKIRNVDDYTSYYGSPALHPLVSVICFDELGEVRHSLNDYEVYGFFLHDESHIPIRRGISEYHYTRDSLICVSPGNVGGKADDGTTTHLTGWALLFHPSLLAGTSLEKEIDQYGFFSHLLTEALELDPYERNIISSIMRSIRYELQHRKEGMVKEIVVTYIKLILDYCQRAFCRRHPSTEDLTSNDILARLYTLLNTYYKEGRQHEEGIPTVGYCAGQLCLTANYFGDVVKSATGDTAQHYLHRFLVARAKRLLLDGKTTAETAYQLGFDYPQHLNRMFRNIEGCSPSEYQKSLLG